MQEAGSDVDHLGFQPLPIREVRDTGHGFTRCANTPVTIFSTFATREIGLETGPQLPKAKQLVSTELGDKSRELQGPRDSTVSLKGWLAALGDALL